MMSTLIITGVTMRRPITVINGLLTESHDSSLQCGINNITIVFIILIDARKLFDS